jgi:hypothetical protein
MIHYHQGEVRMSLLDIFGGGDYPQPQALPADPNTSEAAAKAREDAANAALADSASRGRRATIAAGDKIALEDQQNLMRKRTGAASAKILG